MQGKLNNERRVLSLNDSKRRYPILYFSRLTNIQISFIIMLCDISRGIIRGNNVNYSGSPMTEAMYYILLALMNPNHGYQLMAEIEQVSNGRIKMGPGTLY